MFLMTVILALLSRRHELKLLAKRNIMSADDYIPFLRAEERAAQDIDGLNRLSGLELKVNMFNLT